MQPRLIYSFIVISVLIISFVSFHINILEGNRGSKGGGGRGSHRGGGRGSHGGGSHGSHGYHSRRSHRGGIGSSYDRTSKHGYRRSSYYGGIGNNQGAVSAFNPLYYAPLYYGYYQADYLPEYYQPEYYPKEEEEDDWFSSLFF
jgi:hypothetical protein